MKSFFSTFFASLLALIVFSVFGLLIFITVISAVSSSSEKETLAAKSILVVDLAKKYEEVGELNPFAAFGDEDDMSVPSSYETVRLIKAAAKDSNIEGIYLACGTNSNGFGTSDEIRNALLEFKSTKKFVIAYSNVITQGGYFVANVADKIYCNPQGGLDWRGYSMNYFFMKGALDKLEIEPQIFYAGKFKSATEPFRVDKMTEPNRLQSGVLMNDLYQTLLLQTASARKIDTANLRAYADQHQVALATDAVKLHLIDGVRYDDEVKAEMRQRMGLDKDSKINMVSLAKYAKSASFKPFGKDKIGVIYAQGDIIDGKAERNSIGSESYVTLVRKLHHDPAIKAIVVRINSGGGSSMASENIWRALTLARKDKPVVVSFGDVAASGGYYMACNADSIFAHPNTITGSIGVFSIIPNLQNFFDHKLGVTFDGVKTGPFAEAISVTKPLSDAQKAWLQRDVDSIYQTFLSRVAEGRKISKASVDSIGQGRVWSGQRALQLGLVDRLGGLEDAIACAARMAKTKDYRLREYPEPQTIFERVFGGVQQQAASTAIRKEIGLEQYQLLQQLQKVKAITGIPQTRLPWDFIIE